MEETHLERLLQDIHIDSDIITCDPPSKHTTLPTRQYPNMLRRQASSSPPEMEMDDYSDFSEYSDDDYFSQTYAPLSCLPTPPLSHNAPSPFTQALNAAFDGQEDDIENLGPAIHLCNLIPTSASLITPSPTILQDILYRANLPEQTVCLAVLILDSLTFRFSTSYRKGLPLTPAADSNAIQQTPHIDLVRPELIPLSALLLASKFTTDKHVPTKMAREVGDNEWTCQQINFTELAILENLGWKIKELCVEEELNIAKEDMERAGRNARKRLTKRMNQSDASKKEGQDVKKEMGVNPLTPNDSFENLEGLAGAGVGARGSCWAKGQITPAESP